MSENFDIFHHGVLTFSKYSRFFVTVNSCVKMSAMCLKMSENVYKNVRKFTQLTKMSEKIGQRVFRVNLRIRIISDIFTRCF